MGCSASDSRLPKEKIRNFFPQEYDVTSIIKFLATALDKCDDDAAITCLQQCSTELMSEVMVTYQEVNTVPLLQICDEKLSHRAAFTVRLLVLPQADMTSQMLHFSLHQEDGATQLNIIDIICLCPASLWAEVSWAYQLQHGDVLLGDIQRSGAVCTEVKVILAALLKDDGVLDITATNEDFANRLIEDATCWTQEGTTDSEQDGATCSTIMAKDGPFIEAMHTKSIVDLRLILELFLQKCQRDISVEIKRTYPQGRARDGLVQLVTAIRTPWLHLAETVHTLLGDPTNSNHQMALLYHTMSRNQEEMTSLKEAYVTIFFGTLADDVSADVKDVFLQRTLLATL